MVAILHPVGDSNFKYLCIIKIMLRSTSRNLGGAAADAAGDAAGAAKRAAADAAGDATGAATRAADNAADAARSSIRRAADSAGAGAKKIAKAASDNAGKLIAAGLVIGGARYLEDKFNDADDDIKNCMQVCLPENWDDFNYGDLKKSELKYRVLEGENADPNQPLCTETIEDCGEYCGDKCEELHEYEIPGSNLFGGAGKALKGILDFFKGILGLDGDGFLGKLVSGFCIFILLLIVISVIMKMK